jgi:hypothetical protein
LARAGANSQIYAAGGTRQQLAYLFERTSDLLRETAGVWKEYIQTVTATYDTERRYYLDLRQRMAEAGISPLP